tara:strand:- start:35 stop:286 length:252 start_codon:yes stop_codon:yes gene_type:complete
MVLEVMVILQFFQQLHLPLVEVELELNLLLLFAVISHHLVDQEVVLVQTNVVLDQEILLQQLRLKEVMEDQEHKAAVAVELPQ